MEKGICKVSGCKNKAVRRNRCQKHYRIWLKEPNRDFEPRAGTMPFPKKGEIFGRLTVIRMTDPDDFSNKNVLCRCSCGTKSNHSIYGLRDGSTKSCGCLLHDTLVKRNTTHGLAAHPVFKVFKLMHTRCKYGTYYKDVSICKQWRRTDKGAKNFIEWEASLPEDRRWKPGLQLDRENNNLGYHPKNCRFVTARENMNNRSCSRMYKVGENRMNIYQIAEEFDIIPMTFMYYWNKPENYSVNQCIIKAQKAREKTRRFAKERKQ